MASLYQRLIGDVPIDGAPSEEKIPLHGFRSVLVKHLQGEISAGQAASLWSLDAGQISSAQTLIDAIDSLPSVEAKRRFLDWLFTDLVLGELGYLPGTYRVESAFNARFSAEVARVLA